MDDDVRRRREMFGRVKQFHVENPPPAGKATEQAAIVDAIVDSTDVSTSEQQEGFLDSGSAFDIKATRRENLRDQCFALSRTARAMEYEFDGIAAQYRMPPNLTDAALIAVGHAFHTNSAAQEADFIAYGMSTHFRTFLNDAITAFESSAADTGAAIDKHVAATATSRSQVREGMIAVRILDGIYRNTITDPGIMAAWLSASHVERAPVTPPPPPVDP